MSESRNQKPVQPLLPNSTVEDRARFDRQLLEYVGKIYDAVTTTPTPPIEPILVKGIDLSSLGDYTLGSLTDFVFTTTNILPTELLTKKVHPVSGGITDFDTVLFTVTSIDRTVPYQSLELLPVGDYMLIVEYIDPVDSHLISASHAFEVLANPSVPSIDLSAFPATHTRGTTPDWIFTTPNIGGSEVILKAAWPRTGGTTHWDQPVVFWQDSTSRTILATDIETITNGDYTMLVRWTAAPGSPLEEIHPFTVTGGGTPPTPEVTGFTSTNPFVTSTSQVVMTASSTLQLVNRTSAVGSTIKEGLFFVKTLDATSDFDISFKFRGTGTVNDTAFALRLSTGDITGDAFEGNDGAEVFVFASPTQVLFVGAVSSVDSTITANLYDNTTHTVDIVYTASSGAWAISFDGTPTLSGVYSLASNFSLLDGTDIRVAFGTRTSNGGTQTMEVWDIEVNGSSWMQHIGKAWLVDPTSGSNLNNGSTSPFQSVSTAISAVVSGRGDHVLIKRGQTVTSPIGNFSKSGFGASRYFVLGSYRTDPSQSNTRPIIKCGVTNGVLFNGNASYVMFNQLDFWEHTRDPADGSYAGKVSGGNAIRSVSRTLNHIRIEDCVIRRFAEGLVIQAARGLMQNIFIHRCIVKDTYPNGSNGQGMYSEGLTDFEITDTVFYKNGWHDNPAESRTIFNHGIYNVGPLNGIIRNCLFLNSSSFGVNNRTGISTAQEATNILVEDCVIGGGCINGSQTTAKEQTPQYKGRQNTIRNCLYHGMGGTIGFAQAFGQLMENQVDGKVLDCLFVQKVPVNHEYASKIFKGSTNPITTNCIAYNWQSFTGQHFTPNSGGNVVDTGSTVDLPSGYLTPILTRGLGEWVEATHGARWIVESIRGQIT